MADEDLDFAIALSLQEVDNNQMSTAVLATNSSKSGRNVRTGGFGQPLSAASSVSNSILESGAKLLGGGPRTASVTTPVVSQSSMPVPTGTSTKSQSNPFGCPTCSLSCSSGSYLNALGHRYHPDCFKCAGCNEVITGSFSYTTDPQQPYHADCYKQLFSPVCCVCSKSITGSYLSHSFFKNFSYCKSHEYECRRCCSCDKREPKEASREPFQELPDGRVSCLECISLAVLDSSEAKPLYLEAVNFIEHGLGLPIPPGMRGVPILAVDIPSLNAQKQNGIQPFHRSHVDGRLAITGFSPSDESMTRGLTISSIGSINHFAPGGFHWDRATGSLQLRAPEIFRTEEVREVSAVLVLVGFPRDLTASILAHEAMHVWIKLSKNMPYNLPPKTEEGLCQLIAMKYLEAGNISENPGHLASYCGQCDSPKTSAARGGSWDNQLRQYYRYSIETDPSVEYGEGYRLAAECCSLLGMEVLLDHVRQERSLPIIH